MSFHCTKWQNAQLKQRRAISWTNSFCHIWHERDKGLVKEKTWSDRKCLYLFIFPALSRSGFFNSCLRALSSQRGGEQPSHYRDLIDWLMPGNWLYWIKSVWFPPLPIIVTVCFNTNMTEALCHVFLSDLHLEIYQHNYSRSDERKFIWLTDYDTPFLNPALLDLVMTTPKSADILQLTADGL